MTLHVVQFSGGIGSWAAAQRVAAEHGTQDLVLLFTDTLAEDPDLYRFSEFLKQRPCRAWLEAHADLADTVLHIGIDWSEQRRVPAIEHGWEPWTVSFPMCAPPHLTKDQMIAEARAAGIEPPRLYGLGFGHNNCGGLCVRGGHRHWARVLEVFPDRYAQAERQEQELRAELGDVAILRDRTGGTSRPLALTEFRERQESERNTTAA